MKTKWLTILVTAIALLSLAMTTQAQNPSLSSSSGSGGGFGADYGPGRGYDYLYHQEAGSGSAGGYGASYGPGRAYGKAVPAGVNAVSVDWATDLIHVIKSGPPKAIVGQTVLYTLDVKCIRDAAEVVITDFLPEGATYVKSEPEGGVSGNVVSWRFKTMNQGDVGTLKVWARMDSAGRMRNCATVSAMPRGCIETLVGKPVLGIQKTGPATASVGQNVTYQVVVSNNGDTTVENVVVTDTVPAGMSHASGQSTISYKVGNLEPGKSKTIPVTLKALQRGKFTDRAVAESTNAGKVESDATTVVTQPELLIKKTGTKQQYIGRTATYDIVVSNPGDAPLSDVVVTDNAPTGNRILSAEGATISHNKATWRLGTLGPEEKRTMQMKLTSSVAGSFSNEASATGGGLTANASADTVWKGFAGLLLEMVDTVDPVQIGETTDYVITITNQGTAPDNNIKMVLQLPPQMEFVSVTGSTAGHAEGKTVTFDAYPQLNPKQSVRWTVKTKAVTAGDARTTVRYSSDLIKAPVAKEESTHTY
ncbi:MAG: CARDB domain-containing protein [Verrucomicrobiia bacterium]